MPSFIKRHSSNVMLSQKKATFNKRPELNQKSSAWLRKESLLLEAGPGIAHNYAYFLLMAIITCFWFISILVDNIFYYKSTSYDDVNPHDMSHVCFIVNESYRVANCSQNDQLVICYLARLAIYSVRASRGWDWHLA